MVLIEQANFPVILKDSDGRQADLADLMRLRETALEKDRKNIDRQIKSVEIGVAGERSAAHFLNREFGQSRAAEREYELADVISDIKCDLARLKGWNMPAQDDRREQTMEEVDAMANAMEEATEGVVAETATDN